MWLQDPHAPRTQAKGSPRAALGEVRSPHSSGRPLSPTVPLHASSGSPHAGLPGSLGQHSTTKAAAAAALSSTAVHQMLNRQVPQVQQLHKQQLQQQQDNSAQQLAAGSSGASRPAQAAAGVDDAAVVDALLKYKFYKQFGIDPQHVAPYQEEWLQKALQLVPGAPPPMVSQVCSSN